MVPLLPVMVPLVAELPSMPSVSPVCALAIFTVAPVKSPPLSTSPRWRCRARPPRSPLIAYRCAGRDRRRHMHRVQGAGCGVAYAVAGRAVVDHPVDGAGGVAAAIGRIAVGRAEAVSDRRERRLPLVD